MATISIGKHIFFGDPMKNAIKRLAKNRLTWIALGSLLAAAGINLPPQALDALPVIGPLLVE